MPCRQPRYRLFIAVIAAALLANGLVACTQAPPGTTASGHVASDGFSLKTKEASAAADAGVAKVNTTVELAEVTHTFSESDANDFVGIGQAVRLRLTDDEQPKKTITIRFKVNRSKVSEASWSTPQTYAVLTQPAGSSATTLMPATYDAKNGEVIVKTNHLSFFQPVQLNVPAFLKTVGDTILKGLNITYDQPSCKGKQLSAIIGSVKYTVGTPWALTPCLSNDNGKLKLSLYSTTGIPFAARSAPVGTTTPSPGLSAPSVGGQAAFDLLFSEHHTSFIAPGGELDYEYSDTASKFLSFQEQPAMMLLETLLDVFTVVVPDGRQASQALRALGKLDCMSQLKDTAEQSNQLSASLAAHLVSTFISCGGEVLGTVMSLPEKIIWTIVTAAPALLVNMARGIITTLTGQGTFNLAITATTIAPQPVPDGNANGSDANAPAWVNCGPEVRATSNAIAVRTPYGALAFCNAGPGPEPGPVYFSDSALGNYKLNFSLGQGTSVCGVDATHMVCTNYFITGPLSVTFPVWPGATPASRPALEFYGELHE